MPARKKTIPARKTAVKKPAARKTVTKKAARKKSTRGRKPKGFTKKTFQGILEKILEGEKTLVAISQAGFSHDTFYRWIRRWDEEEDSTEYSEALKRAQLHRDQILNQGKLEEGEAELKRRAVDGWEEPRFHEGELVGTVRKYSDTCLIFMLKALAPDKYREAAQVQNHINVGNTQPLPTQAERKKMEADLADMVRGLQTAAARGSIPLVNQDDQDD